MKIFLGTFSLINANNEKEITNIITERDVADQSRHLWCMHPGCQKHSSPCMWIYSTVCEYVEKEREEEEEEGVLT
jgi:hypothetical protein